jgi:hypothetical protein
MVTNDTQKPDEEIFFKNLSLAFTGWNKAKMLLLDVSKHTNYYIYI